jgi:signal transduction histidine kinase
MSRVFLNVCGNAWDAAIERYEQKDGEHPCVTVTSSRFARHIEIRIHDNGTGIPKHIRNRIFDPFFTTKPTDKGTGLGLSISHDIITRLHRGSIHVETEVGSYSEFVITIPV